MGYVMRDSYWTQLQVEKVQTAIIDPDADTFDHKLSLNKDIKKIIKDLVVNHEEGKKRDGTGLDDLIEDKGKGLVLLFHGPPGVGKTNLEENALVSVLLRVLEYYEGILILTTNRINSFDVAVQSGVRLAVKYQNFNETQISEIYTIFLKQIREDDNIEHWNSILSWIKVESRSSKFNGRQIRNIVSAALGLARAERKKLNSDHLDQIVRKTTEFYDELAEQRKAYEMKQLARGYGER